MKKILIYMVRPSVFNSLLIFFSFYLLCIMLEFSCVLGFFISLIASELICRAQFFLFHKKKKEKRYFLTKKDIPFTNHPYLPWVMRKNWRPPNNKQICHEKDFMLSSVAFDARGIGYDSNENCSAFPISSSNSCKVLILGDSVSMSYASSSRRINYPQIIEKNLRESLGEKNIEVVNGAFFAYTSQELLVKFLFDLQYLDPDYVIFYGGYADIRGYLTKGFETDFSHFRKSINPNYQKTIAVSSLLSLLNSYFLDSVTSRLLFKSNLKLDLIKMINKQEFIDLSQSPKKGLETFSRNIETLIHVCKGKNIPFSISTYCHYLDNDRKKSDAHQIFHSIIQQQNCLIRDLCLFHNVSCVDNANFIELSDKNFLDDVHFTEKGMRFIADNFTREILKNQKIMEKLNDC